MPGSIIGFIVGVILGVFFGAILTSIAVSKGRYESIREIMDATCKECKYKEMATRNK